MIKGISTNSPLFTSISKNDEKEKSNVKTEKVEKSKIESIKEAIHNGTYNIDINKTSESMAKKLL